MTTIHKSKTSADGGTSAKAIGSGDNRNSVPYHQTPRPRNAMALEAAALKLGFARSRHVRGWWVATCPHCGGLVVISSSIESWGEFEPDRVPHGMVQRREYRQRTPMRHHMPRHYSGDQAMACRRGIFDTPTPRCSMNIHHGDFQR